MFCHTRGIQSDIPRLSANQHSGLDPTQLINAFMLCAYAPWSKVVHYIGLWSKVVHYIGLWSKVVHYTGLWSKVVHYTGLWSKVVHYIGLWSKVVHYIGNRALV